MPVQIPARRSGDGQPFDVETSTLLVQVALVLILLIGLAELGRPTDDELSRTPMEVAAP